MHISQAATFQIEDAVRAFLSLASDEAVHAKNPSRDTVVSYGRLPLTDHLHKLVAEADYRSASLLRSQPVLTISCRNVLANPRCGAWVRGRTPSFLCVTNEDPSRSLRPYHVLGFKHGRFVLDELFPDSGALADYEWALSGVPIYWNGEPIRDRMIAETSDFSHIYALPRGGHPDATERSVARWRQLHDRALEVLYAERRDAAGALLELTTDLPVETTYLHNCAGVTEDGRLIVIVANGGLERLGRALAACGAARAIVLDNGGSSSVSYYPNGCENAGVQLIAAPNFRAAGTAYMAIVLGTPIYAPIPGGTFLPDPDT